MQNERGFRKIVIREVREETGLDVSDCEGGLSFTYQTENLEEGDNYFVDVYHFIKDFPKEDVVLQKRNSGLSDCNIRDTGNCKEGKFCTMTALIVLKSKRMKSPGKTGMNTKIILEMKSG